MIQYASERVTVFQSALFQTASNHLKRLREAVIAGDETTIGRLEKEHAFFPPTTQESHRENVRIIRSEYTSS